jgi:DNA invertase Pin-like site-specific DNA recombinase
LGLQTLDAQLEQLRAAGCNSRNSYREKVTGARADRRELLRLLDRLTPGDVVTVTRIDRLARSIFDLFGIVKRIVDAKAQFRSLAEPWADTGTSTGRLMIAVLDGLADVERDLIRARTAEGRSRAKAKGKQMGRPPSLDDGAAQRGHQTARARRYTARTSAQLQRRHIHNSPRHEARRMTETIAGNRLEDLKRFYSIIEELERRLSGCRRLTDTNGRMYWPQRGIYFFFESGEQRTDSGTGPRVVRVGTHAVTPTSATTLWGRLRQHRGSAGTRHGNHRGSVFRKHVGYALIHRTPDLACLTWGDGTSAPKAVRDAEQYLEIIVSEVIGQMPFLWLGIGEIDGGHNTRDYLERHAIALLSNYRKPMIDPPSQGWLGCQSPSERVRYSGLWNSDYVTDAYDPAFLNRMERLVMGIGR